MRETEGQRETGIELWKVGKQRWTDRQADRRAGTHTRAHRHIETQTHRDTHTQLRDPGKAQGQRSLLSRIGSSCDTAIQLSVWETD